MRGEKLSGRYAPTVQKGKPIGYENPIWKFAYVL
jgi:hypothetical protein